MTSALYRRALEAKAAIYARLSGGDGVREEEEDEGEGEEPRYMVDFTRKIWEEVISIFCVGVLLVLTVFPRMKSKSAMLIICSSRTLTPFNHYTDLHVLDISKSVFSPEFSEGLVGGCGLGGVSNHIKAFKLHLLQYQRELLTEGP